MAATEPALDPAVAAGEHVLEHGELLEEADVLEGPGDAERDDAVGEPFVMSLPSKRTVPLSERWLPVMRLKTVVLPAPFGPMSPTMVPSSTSKETSFTALSPPKDLVRSADPSRLMGLPLPFRASGKRVGPRPRGRMPSVRTIIMTTMAAPKISMRASAKSRKTSGQAHDEDRPQQHAGDASRAAQDDDGEHDDRFPEAEGLGRDDGHLGGEDVARHARPGRAQDEGGELVVRRC